MFMNMIDTETQKTVRDITKETAVCASIGRDCWKDWCDSEDGSFCLKRMDSDIVRERAEGIFILGFCVRMMVSPPVGPNRQDRMTEERALNRLWVEHLETCGGEIVLDGLPFPFTDEIVLRVAKQFFRMGFQHGTHVWRHLRNECYSAL